MVVLWWPSEELPNKTDADYSTKIKNILEDNKGIRLNKFMAFTGKPKNHHSSLGKVLHKLFKQDRSIFYKTYPRKTVMNNKFIDKVVSKVESNRNSDEYIILIYLSHIRLFIFSATTKYSLSFYIVDSKQQGGEDW